MNTFNFSEKYNQIRRNFCFYLDIQDHVLSRSLSRKLHEMGIQEEVFLTPQVSHVVRDREHGTSTLINGTRWRRERNARADAMLQRVHTQPSYTPVQQINQNYIQLSVEKALNLLDKLYETFFAAPRKTPVRVFTKHFIKIEFLDKPHRPIYKEFDAWPAVLLEPDLPKPEQPIVNNNSTKNTTAERKMTRKIRPKIKAKDEKETKGGYCEMCNADYVDAALHRRSQTHLAFVKDHNNFISLDTLINTGTDVTTFLDKSTPINGERRSLRKICNGDVDQKCNRSKQSQSPDTTFNGNESPKRNGALDDEKKHDTRCSRKNYDSQTSEERQYYKVVGVSTKLRSSSGFGSRRKDSNPTCNGTKPLVVKFRKVRRSQLSVLSDEAEQFMFPKRASSASSTSSEDEKIVNTKRKSNNTTQEPPISLERRRLARPLAFKEESSEEDIWPINKKRRKRRNPAVTKKTRRVPSKVSPAMNTSESQSPVKVTPHVQIEPTPCVQIEPTPCVQIEPTPHVQIEPTPRVQIEPTPHILIEPIKSTLQDAKLGEVNPLQQVVSEKCMKWEDGKLKYTPAVDQLHFAFESVPQSEPWFETFKRQDQDKVMVRNVTNYFALYSKSPKLPYEVGQLPPLKPNCCPLSDLVKREEKAGPSKSYGTRGMKKQRIRKRTAAILALETHPRKSPREHASTLAILGSAGLLHRRRNAEDAKSTASEDTISDTHSATKVETFTSEIQITSERLQQFFSEVFEDAREYDISEGTMDGEPTVTTSTNVPDVANLVSECEDCDILQNEMKAIVQQPRRRRGKFKKKNRTGWPTKKKQFKNNSRSNSIDANLKEENRVDRLSMESLEDDTTQDTLISDNVSETDHDMTLKEVKLPSQVKDNMTNTDTHDSRETEDEDKPLKHIKILVQKKHLEENGMKNLELDTKDKEATLSVDVVENEDKKPSTSVDASETDDDKPRKKKKTIFGVGNWLQPIVRVARVDPNTARQLRSGGTTCRTRANRSR